MTETSTIEAHHPILSPPVLATPPAPDIDDVFRSIVEAHGDRLFSTALRLTGRRADAEDLTAETFLRAYRSLCGFDAQRIRDLRSRAWLSTIMINEWRNQLRGASRRPATAPVDADHEPDLEDTGPGVEAQAEARQEGRDLAGLLAVLPERQREAIVLRYIGDLAVSDIAAVMACPAGTVKSHISRGLAALRPAVPASSDPAAHPRGGPS